MLAIRKRKIVPGRMQTFLECMSVGIISLGKYVIQHPARAATWFLLLNSVGLIGRKMISESDGITLVTYESTTPEGKFDEYKVASYGHDEIDDDDDEDEVGQLIHISPLTQIEPVGLFTEEYLKKHKASLIQGGFFARGDTRSPEEGDKEINAKCKRGFTPHYDITIHRKNSDCSGLSSVTRNMKIAREFGMNFYNDEGYHYILLLQLNLSLWQEETLFSHEEEFSALGPLPIVGYRRCRGSSKNYKCDGVMISTDLDPKYKEKILLTQLLPSESKPGVHIKWKAGENPIQDPPLPDLDLTPRSKVKP